MGIDLLASAQSDLDILTEQLNQIASSELQSVTQLSSTQVLYLALLA